MRQEFGSLQTGIVTDILKNVFAKQPDMSFTLTPEVHLQL